MLNNVTDPFARSVIYEHFYSMENWTMWASLVLVVGMTLTLLIIAFLLKAKKTFNQRLLAVVFGACFFFLLYYYGFLYGSYQIGSIAFLFGNGLGFLLGPLLYFYVKSLTVPKEYIVRPLLMHLIPYFTCWVFISVPVAVNIWDGEAFQSVHNWYVSITDYFIIAENIFLLGYIFFTLRLLKRLQVLYKSHYSFLDNRDLLWCRDLLFGLSLIVIADIGFSIYELNYPPLTWNIGTITAFAFVGLFGFLGYKGMLQSQILVPDFLLQTEMEQAPALVKSSTQSDDHQPARSGQLAGLSELEIDELVNSLFKALDEDKVYLDSNLNLQDLAKRIDISAKQLSELLNQHLKTSFYDLINDYRVETVKEKLHSGDFENLTLLAIAFDSGFKSKTSFNRVFKAKTNYSPSEYKHKISRVEVAE